MASVTLKIDGMSCGHCVSAVNKALRALPGITDLKVEIGSAAVGFDAGQVSVDKLKEAVEDEGYEVVGTSA